MTDELRTAFAIAALFFALLIGLGIIVITAGPNKEKQQ